MFVEAKGVDTTLDADHRQQLQSYMRQVGVDWGLLTNGQAFELMRRDTSSDRPNEVTLAEFTLVEIEDHEQALKAISRESIESGEAEQIATKLEAIQAAVRTLREDKEAIAEAVTGAVTERTGDAVAQEIEREAKTFVDQLRESLADQAAGAEDDSKGTAKGAEPAEPDNESGGYTIRILNDGREQGRVSGATQADAMEAFAAWLVDEGALLETISLPYVPGSGRGDRALLNTSPQHTDDTDMYQYRHLSEDLYLFTNLSKDAKQRYCTELAEQVGLSCAYTGDW